MRTRYILFICFCLTGTSTVWSQWTEKDSIWLQNMLSGKEEIKLKPEVLEAIDKGTFINTDVMQPKEQFRQSPTEIPISKDFTEYIAPKDKEKPVDALSIPPAVFMRYGLNIPLPTIYTAFLVPESIKKSGAKPSGISFDDTLKHIFSPKERRKARARQNANAWKNYNGFR